MPILMPLKEKYRRPGRLYRRPWDPVEGTMCYSAGTHPSKKGGNSGTTKGKVVTVRPRMKSYWGSVWRP